MNTLTKDFLYGFLAPPLIAVPAALLAMHNGGYTPAWLPGALIALAIVATTGSRRVLVRAVRP